MAAPDVAGNIDVLRQSELAKLPIFAGDSKDQFTAEQWVERIDRARRASNWDEDQTMAFVFNALRGHALLWYDSLRRTGIDRDNWAPFSAAFLESWSATRTARTTTVNLADLRQGQNETVNCFYPRVVKAVDDLEALVPGRAFPLPATPFPQEFTAVAGFAALAANIKTAAANDLVTHGATAAFNHMALNLFVSNLRPALRDEVLKLKPTTLYDAFQQAIQLEHIHTDPKRTTLPAMPVDVSSPPDASAAASSAAPDDSDDLDKEIDALNFKLRNLKNRRDNRAGTSNNRPFSRSGNSASRNNRPADRSAASRDVICHYCQKRGHFQIDCRSRKRDNAPMVRTSSASGSAAGSRSGATRHVDQVTQNPFINPFSYAYPAQQDFRPAEC